MSKIKLRERTALDPAELRALRDELGWSHEGLADAVGVSPLEVSAWEAGAVPIDPAQQVEIARERSRTLRARAVAAAGLEPCAHVATMTDLRVRAEQQARGRLVDALQSRMERHQKRCSTCRRIAQVERQIPMPDPPLPHTPSGWIARALHLGRGLPKPWGSIVSTGATFVGVLGGVSVVSYLTNPSRGFHLQVSQCLLAMAGAGAFLLAGRLLGDLYDDHPYLAGLLQSSSVLAVAVAAMAWSPQWGVEGPAAWVILALLAAIGGFLLGRPQHEARTMEREALGGGPMQSPAVADRVETARDVVKAVG